MKQAPYRPDPIKVPPLYAWPSRPIATLRCLTIGLMAPWGVFWIALALLIYRFATPSLNTAQSPDIGWIAGL